MDSSIAGGSGLRPAKVERTRSAPKRLNRAPLLTRIARPVFMAKTPKTNPHLQRVVRELREVSRKAEAPIWRDVAERLERSRKNWSEVNLSRLSRYAAKGEQIVVPGVVLATGEITTAVTVAAFRSSEAARKKIEATGGHDPPPLDLAHDAVPATARTDRAEAVAGLPLRARRVEGQAARDHRGREAPAARAVHQPRRDLEAPRVEVRGPSMKAIVASGKRKTAVARATLTKGRGVVRINSVPVEMYPFELGRLKILEPLKLAGRKVDSIDIDVNVHGG